MARWCVWLVILALALGACACEQGRAAARAGGTLLLAMPASFGLLDPHRMAYSTPLFTALYDTLLSLDQDGNPAAGLAKQWSVSADGLSLTITLRDGIRFHDGTALDGAAVVANLQRVSSGGPDRYPVARLLGPLRGARADGLTVTLTYGAPFPPVWSALADPRLAMVAPATLDAFDRQAGDGASAGALVPGEVCGTGPFRLVEMDAGRYLLQRNEAYAWPPAGGDNPGPAYPNQVAVTLVSSEGDDAASWPSASDCDIAWCPPSTLAGSLAPSEGAWRVVPYGGDSLIYLSFSVTGDEALEPAVREAITLLLDRQAIAALAGWPWAAADAMLPGGLPGAPGTAARSAQLNRARSLLGGAGWRTGEDGVLRRDGRPLEVRLATYEGDGWYGALADEIGRQLAATGITVRMVAPRRVVSPGLVAGAANVWLSRYEWPDPDVLYYLFHSSGVGSGNRAGYSDPAVDLALAAARREMDPSRRAADYRDAIQRVAKANAATGLLETSGDFRLGTRVAGWRAPLRGRFEWADIYLRSR